MDSFYCTRCKKDFTASSRKEQLSSGEKYLTGNCVCGKRAVRYITEAKVDPYFRQSKVLQVQRQQYKKDMLQPGDPGFALAYPQSQKKLDEAKAKLEAKRKQDKAQQLALWKQHRHNINERKVIEKFIEL